MPEPLKTLGLFGGTFDPIHFGHLRAALEIKEALQLEEMRLIPAHHPPHRTSPIASPKDRLKMSRIAAKKSGLVVDAQEMRRDGPSYSIDTLMALRKRYPETSFCMVVGLDAFLGLPSWYQWEKLIQLTNIVVMHRTGLTLPKTGFLQDLLSKHTLNAGEKITNFPHGRIITQIITTLDISASQIRDIIQQQKSPDFLLPEKVWQYIRDHELYGYTNHLLTKTEEEKL